MILFQEIRAEILCISCCRVCRCIRYKQIIGFYCTDLFLTTSHSNRNIVEIETLSKPSPKSTLDKSSRQYKLSTITLASEIYLLVVYPLQVWWPYRHSSSHFPCISPQSEHIEQFDVTVVMVLWFYRAVHVVSSKWILVWTQERFWCILDIKIFFGAREIEIWF